MKTYSLSNTGWLQYRLRILQRFGITAIFAVAVIIFMALRQTPPNWFCGIFPTTLLFAGVFGFSMYRSLKQQREVWDSLRIVIGEDYVARQQLRVPEIHINRNEVTALKETNNGIIVYTADKFRSLVIPLELDGPGFDEIKNTLAAWMPIQPKAPNTNIKNNMLVIVLLIGFAVLFFSWSAWLVMIVGVGMIGYYLYLFSLLQRDKGIDPKVRQNYIVMLVLLVFIFATKLCVLFGWYKSFLTH